MLNILTIDVEEWFMDTDISRWSQFEDRVLEPTYELLKVLRNSHQKATFFIVGYIAEKYPDLVADIYNDGHEIGTHGYAHKPMHTFSSQSFEKDLKKSLVALHSIIDQDVLSHRACQFSLNEHTSWSLPIMKKLGIRYDSSIFPVKSPLYGVPDAPKQPYSIDFNNISNPSSKEDIHEFPLSVLTLPLITNNMPIAGGFYFRLFPYYFSKYIFKYLNYRNKVGVFYLHPWEFDESHPYLDEFEWYHYFNLKSTRKKFNKLSKDFDFISICDYMGNGSEHEYSRSGKKQI